MEGESILLCIYRYTHINSAKQMLFAPISLFQIRFEKNSWCLTHNTKISIQTFCYIYFFSLKIFISCRCTYDVNWFICYWPCMCMYCYVLIKRNFLVDSKPSIIKWQSHRFQIYRSKIICIDGRICYIFPRHPQSR